MNKKKWAIVAVSLLLVAVLGVGTYFAIPSLVVRNVFDEMYYSIKQEPEAPEPPFWKEKLNSHYYTDTSFYNIDGVEQGSYGKWRRYVEPSIDEMNGSIGIDFNKEEKSIIFTNIHNRAIEQGELEGLEIIFTYNVQSKTLICTMQIYSKILSTDGNYEIQNPDVIEVFLNEHNITREQIEGYKHFVLYERLLPDWFAGNAGLSRYSPGNLGSFTYDDRTYEGLEGWTS